MSALSACLQCVKKEFIYTGNTEQPCVFSLKDIKVSTEEIDAVLTKVDCMITYPPDSTPEWIIVTAGACFGFFIIVLMAVLLYEVHQNRKIRIRVGFLEKAVKSSAIFGE